MEDYIYKKARKRVKQKKGFYVHLSVFIAVGIFFLTMNLVTDPWDLWFFYPLMPWGVGLLIHYFGIFGLPGKNRVLTNKWEEQEMEKEIRRLERMKGKFEEPERESLDLQDFNRSKEKVKMGNKQWREDDLV